MTKRPTVEEISRKLATMKFDTNGYVCLTPMSVLIANAEQQRKALGLPPREK